MLHHTALLCRGEEQRTADPDPDQKQRNHFQFRGVLLWLLVYSLQFQGVLLWLLVYSQQFRGVLLWLLVYSLQAACVTVAEE